MKNIIRNTFYSVCVLFILLIAAILFLVTSTPGTNLLINYFNKYSEYEILLEKPQGSLLGNLQAERALITGHDLKIILTNFKVNTKLHAIFSKEIFLNINAKEINVVKLPSSNDETKDLWPFPFTLKINKLQTNKLIVKPLDLDIANLLLKGELNRRQWKIDKLKLTIDNVKADIKGIGSSKKPFATQASIDIKPMMLEDLLISLNITGNLDEYYLQGTFKGAATGDIKGKIVDAKRFEGNINWKDANFKEYDLQSPFGHLRIKGEKDNWDVFTNLKINSPLNVSTKINAKVTKNIVRGQSVIELDENKIQGSFKYSFNEPDKFDIAIGDNHFAINKSNSIIAINAKLNNFGQLHESLQGLNTSGTLDATLQKDKSIIQLNLDSGVYQTGNPQLSEITFDNATFNAKVIKNNWNIEGSLQEQDKILNLKGLGKIDPLEGNIHISGDQLKLIDTQEYLIYATPRININFNKDIFNITGEIYIPRGEITPVNFSDSVTLTTDAKFINRETKPQPVSTFNQNISVDLIMGDNVKVNVKGLHGFLRGAINIATQDGSAPIATGSLNLANAKYEAYGQNLTIEKGVFTFNDELITNPHVYLRAVRYFNNLNQTFGPSNQLFDFNPENIHSLSLPDNLKVGIEVTGRLQTTKINLFSIPGNLSQADILSFLLLGKPASQAGSSGGQLLMTAVSSMDLGKGVKGTQLLTQLKDKLAIDIDIQNISTFDRQTGTISDTTALVLGKSLTKRLYLSYNIGLFEDDINVLTLRYILNKFFSIQITSSSASNGIDFLYTRSKDSLWPIF